MRKVIKLIRDFFASPANARAIFFLFAFFLLISSAKSQSKLDSIFNKLDPEKFIASINKKAEKLEDKLVAKSMKVLEKFKQQEEKLRKKLYKIDSSAAKTLFDQGIQKYSDLNKKLKGEVPIVKELKPGNYIPFLDSIKTSLNFLQKNPSLLPAGSKEIENKLKETIAKTDLLKTRFDQTAAIQKFMRERKQYLKEQLSKFGLVKELKKLNKEAYYYSQLIKDYKEVFSDPKKAERLVLAALNKIPAFKNFMQKNSMLASLFGTPSNSPSGISMTGLQTRVSVQQTISRSVIGAGPNPARYISQQLQNANSQLSSLKNRIAFIDLSGNAEPMPDFKPNTQKTKSVLKRIELSANVQFGKTNQLLPASGDFAFSVGYKLNDKGVIGVGSSYKLGFGSLQRIQFSHEGFSLRSYIDWKIKSGFYISGGYEKNYLPRLQNISVSQPLSSWQESGLIGISKRVNITKKKKLSTQILFDFLSYKNIPRSQPFLFRTGWVF